MTGTESVYPKGQLRFTSEVAGQYGLVVQTFVETKCETCGNLHETDLQHVTKKDEALKRTGEAWGLCKPCLEKGHSRDLDYGMEMSGGEISLAEARRLYPHAGLPGDQIKIGLRGNLVGGKVTPSKEWYVGVSHPSDFEDLKRPECPGNLEERCNDFKYKPDLISKQIEISEKPHGDILRVKDEASFISEQQHQLREAYETLHDFHERFDNGASLKAEKQDLINKARQQREDRGDGPEALFKHWGITDDREVGVTKKWADVLL